MAKMFLFVDADKINKQEFERIQEMLRRLCTKAFMFIDVDGINEQEFQKIQELLSRLNTRKLKSN